MSQVLEMVSKVQDKQLAVLGKGHDGLIKLAEQVSDLKVKVQSKLPGSELTSGLSRKVESVLGTPAEYLRYNAEAGTARAKLSQDFQNSLASVLEKQPAAKDENEADAA